MKEISYFVIFIIMTEREIECYFYTLVDMLYEKKNQQPYRHFQQSRSII